MASNITVEYVEQVNELGTQDGTTYRLKPIEECSCEPNFTCYIHAGYFTEEH